MCKNILCINSWRTEQHLQLPVPSYRSDSGRDVLQGSDGGLLCAVTHAAGHERQVHPEGDGAPQPLYALRVSVVLQQGALPLQLLLRRKKEIGWHTQFSFPN